MNDGEYPECRVEVAAGSDREAFACDDAEVRIDGESILISYFDDEGMVVLQGRPEVGEGWRLVARSRPWRAFLRPIGDSPGCFEGEIDAQGELLAWRLNLGPAAG